MKKQLFVFVCAIFFVAVPGIASGQDQANAVPIWSGEVTHAGSVHSEALPGIGTTHKVQEINVRLENGPQSGEVVTVQNDRLPLEDGDKVYVQYQGGAESGTYSVAEVDRRGSMYVALAIFVGAIIAFGGWQGVRSILSLGFSIAAVVFVLLPLLFVGVSPVPVSIGVAALVLFVAIFVTHGFTRNSLIAYSGTLVAVLCAGLLSVGAIWMTRLTGLGVEEAVFLTTATQGAIDPKGLLLAGILIGMIGVLDDIAVTQVAVTAELRHSNSEFSVQELYRRAMRVGQEHVGALVNTLVLAYVGAALPLLLLLYNADAPIGMVLSQEIFVTEIIRALIGSIGLILAVPLTTLAAAYSARRGDSHSHHHH